MLLSFWSWLLLRLYTTWSNKLSVLIANAVVGLILLVVLNYLHVMQWMGKPDLGYDLATVLICAIGGVPGVCILVLLDILGITI